VLAEARQPLTREQQELFRSLVARRRDLEPVAYLTGQREFYGLMFEVTPATLVPRPETELLVDLALKWTVDDGREVVPTVNRQQSTVRVADIGTGTGCIAIAFAVNWPEAKVIAVDRSPEALAVAARNVARHHLGERVRLVEGDLLAPLTEPVDLLLSNPPYTVLAEIDENVRRHEPYLALDGGPDGLDLYRRLLAEAPAKLVPGGAVLLEIGDTQGAAVASLGAQHFPNAQISVHKDLAGLDRVVAILT
jgi:release factor glutamine methyltransferase